MQILSAIGAVLSHASRLCSGVLTRIAPVIPYNPEFDEHVQSMHYFGRVTLVFSIVCQIATTFAATWAWTKLGGSTWPMIVGLAIAAVISVVADIALWRELRKERPGQTGGHLSWMYWLGFIPLMVWLSVAILVGLKATALTLFAVTVPVILWLVLESIRKAVGESLGEYGYKLYAHQARRITWLMCWSALVLGPLLVGWTVASLIIDRRRDDTATIRAWLDAHPPTAAPETDALFAPRDSKWMIDGQPIRVAVTLSGGGYRAVVTQAGVLAALDEQGVPIDIISSVSGGSIIGASYTLGVPPDEFADRLKRQKPGLPDSILHLWSRTKSTSEVYRDHLGDTYFGDRTLNQLPDHPMLLLNVANYNVHPSLAREVIRKGWATKELEEATRIADAVTASGAFPGAFHPIEMEWLRHERGGVAIGSHFLIDGGVVENLGTEGLRQYLTGMAWTEWYRKHPQLLIVSDASAYADENDIIVTNPSAADMILRANGIQFETLNRQIYAELTGRTDILDRVGSAPAWVQYYTEPYPPRYVPRGAPKPGSRTELLQPSGKLEEITVAGEELLTVIIPITLPATRKLLKRESITTGPRCEPAEDIHTRVSSLPTLDELDPQQVEEAYWLGYTLGTLYGQAIECARRRLRGQPCKGPP